MTTRLPFEEIVDRCVEDVVAGRLSVEDAITRFPDEAERLRPLLEALRAFDAAPAVPVRAVDATRRAAFMAALRETPQQSPRRLRLPSLRLPSIPAGGLLLRMAAVPAAAAAVALVALLFTFAQPGTQASAATLTVFQGTVERDAGGTWVPVADGEHLTEGTHFRTAGDGYALLTFADGSTASLAPGTEVTLSRLRYAGTRQVEIEQASGRLWNDVMLDARADAYYVVRTADATVHVTGTVFETVVEAGETFVATVLGRVEVAAGEARVAVQPGEVVRARAQAIAETRAAQRTTAVTIDAPVAAAIVSERGQATGVRPDGVAFQQIAGLATTDPGVGLQRFDLTQVEPGRYTLFLQRVGDGEGVVILQTEAGERRIPVEAGSQGASVVVAIERRDGVSRIVDVLRSAVAVEADVAPVRVAESDRTQNTVPLGIRIAEAAQERNRERQEERDRTNAGTPAPTRTPVAAPTRPPAPPPARTPDATRTPLTTRTPDPTRTAAPFDVDATLRRLLEASRSGDREAFTRALAAALDAAAAAGVPALQRLLEAVAASDLRATLGDGADVRELERAVDTLPEMERDRLREILPPLIPGFGERQSDDSSDEPGLLPRLPADQDDDEDGGLLDRVVPGLGRGSAEMRQSERARLRLERLAERERAGVAPR